MRFDCSETPKQRYARVTNWHRWFAWWPTRVGPNDCRWFETIERKGQRWGIPGFCTWTWQYRAIEGIKP